MNEPAAIMCGPTGEEVEEEIAQRRMWRVDVNFGAAGRQQLGLPGGRIAGAGDDGLFAVQGPEERQRRECGHALRLLGQITPQRG
ncbi:hypothetical protein VP03_13230 [Sinorhizobium meliloti]|nr:hypothetical protein VP03_13230 [Sinorhizobium meliloti]